MSKAKLYDIKISQCKEKLPIEIKKTDKNVVLGMTFISLSGDYGLEKFCRHKQIISGRNLYDEFKQFQNQARQFSDMRTFINAYSPHNGQPKNHSFQIKESERLKKDYNFDAEASHIIHIHAKSHGNGKTVIWGYIYDNVFEVLAIDPKHKSI